MTDPDPRAAEELFTAVREAASPATWSRGVGLVRAEALSTEAADAGEVRVRVATRGGLVAPAVTLHLGDAPPDWECDCRSREDPCEHVAAAVIALRRSREAGRPLAESATTTGRLRYQLARRGRSLHLEREIVAGDAVHPVTSTLAALATGRVAGPAFAASDADLDAERALGPNWRGRVPPHAAARLLGALARGADVRLDSEPIEASGEPWLPAAELVEDRDGFLLRERRDPDVEVFDNGVVRVGGTLRPLGASGLLGREREDLRRGRRYSFDQAALLASEVLPSLRRCIPVDVHSARLPETTRTGVPRARVEVRREGDRLSALATLLYGDPPAARIDAGRLVPLGQGALPIRDEEAERRVVQQLRRELGLAPGHRVALAGEEAIALAERLRTWSGELRGDAHRAFVLAPALEPNLRIEGDRLQLDFACPADPDVPSAPRRVAASAVLRAWQEGASLVPLAGGGFAPLPGDWLERFGPALAELLAARGADGRVATYALPDLAHLCANLDQPPPPGLERLAPLLAGADGVPSAALPGDLRATLRHYQRRGVDWLAFLRDAGLGALLADDMGLGKTLQALCALRGRSLVVSPTSVLSNWESEARRFRPGLRCALYHGPGRALDPEADLTLTSYALLRGDAELLTAQDWDCVVLDEAQAIKNPESQVAQAAFALRARFRLALTGTPVENRLDELWSQLHFLNPGLLGGRRDFQERVARRVADGDAEAAARLRGRIRPFVLRRTKREVVPELPPRTEVVLRCELDETERSVYEAIRAATRRDVVERLRAGGSVLAALEALLRLRQAACHRGLVPGQQAADSSKLALLLERLEEAAADGHRSLVFSQWTALLDRIEPHLRERGIDFTRLDGSTRDRAGVVACFQDESGPPVLLVSLKAGGTGLNLTAADHVFLLDPWWNPAVEEQAADRAHRIGQERPVVVHRLVAKDTVEEGILALQESKRGLSEAALGDADGAAALGRDELLALLSA
jgi:superfamily II DNA or RNA helicase